MNSQAGKQETQKNRNRGVELTATGVETGILLNFHSVPLSIKRVGREFWSAEH